jgi:hypothetical protein
MKQIQKWKCSKEWLGIPTKSLESSLKIQNRITYAVKFRNKKEKKGCSTLK